MKILVVDDSETQRRAARVALSDHELIIVGTAKEARQFLRPEFDSQGCQICSGFDVVLTDLLMGLLPNALFSVF